VPRVATPPQLQHNQAWENKRHAGHCKPRRDRDKTTLGNRRRSVNNTAHCRAGG
jgi:hypothetical protein